MPSQFDFGDDSLKVTARSPQEQRIKAPSDAARVRQTIPSTLASMVFTIWVYSLLWGWPIAIGSVLMIFVHECGHALAAKRFGLPYMGMKFIPGLGGVVFHQKGNTTVVQDGFIGIMGPVFGTLFGIGCLIGFWLTDPFLQPFWHFFWLGLARWTFIVNALNLLIPAPPLDGHWLAAIFARGARSSKNERIKYALAWAGLGLFLVLGIVYCKRQFDLFF